MNPHQYIIEYPERTLSVLGITFEQLNALIGAATHREAQLRADQEKHKKRVNQKGAGSRRALTVNEEICLTLYYFKQAPTFEVLGMQFAVSRTTANDLFHYWINIIRDLLPASLIEEANHQGEMTQLQTQLQEQELLIDSCEQGRSRPTDNQKQRQYYSGKKAQHTFKTQIICLEKGRDIVDVITAARGPEADINLARKRLDTFSEKQQFLGDKAYVGEAQILTPQKKPKGRTLTAQQKESNRQLSKRRIYIEHLIGRVKFFRVVQEKFRLRASSYQLVLLTVCGLTRLRMGTLRFT